jgi:DNA adenine methylase
MTYDDHPEIREMAAGYHFQVSRIKMKTTHHSEKDELLIGRNLDWLDEAYDFRLNTG